METLTTETNTTMAQTGIHIKPCNTGSAQLHNERDKEYLERLDASGKKTYDIYRDETSKNRSWVNPPYQGLTLDRVLQDLQLEVKEKTGRSMQAKATPIREGVCPILATTKPKDFQPVIDWYAAHGATVIRIDLHHDEGHTDAVTGERHHNHHAHVIVDYIDHSTGRSVKLTKEDISELQGVVADALGMERGTPKKLTGKEHLEAQEYREKMAGENAAQLEARCQELEKKVKAGVIAHEKELRAICKQFQGIGRNTVKNFDYIQGFKIPQLAPTPKEQEHRDQLAEECRRDLSPMNIPELMQEQSLLRTLIANTQRAIQRIGEKLQKLATSIPFWKKPRLAHEADLQAAVSNANAERDQARAEAENAVKSAENAQSAAETAKANADNLAQLHREALQNIDADKAAAWQEGRKAGASAKHQEWQKWYNETGKPAIEERDQLREEKTEWEKERKGWLQDFKDIAKALVSHWDDETVQAFEKQGIREMVGSNLWDAAKHPKVEKSEGFSLHP